MYKILNKEILNPQVIRMEVEAPLIANKARAGQFIIFRVDEHGERVPLTISDYDREKGCITLIFQTVGKSTTKLGQLNQGDYIHDVVGPLGVATHFGDNIKKAAVIGGGLGTAIAYPQAKALHDMGVSVTSICGFRNTELIILKDEVEAISNKTIITTDDGSNGNKGFVTTALEQEIESGEKFDLVIAIGPLIMMKFVSKLTEKYGIKTIVSMNSIMIDGTGMCGSCRVTVDGKTKFACIDGPDFDGHKIDFDQAMRRQNIYKNQEKDSLDRYNDQCKLLKEDK